jgi:glycine oxidase
MKHIIIGNGIIALTTAFKLLNRLGPTDTITIIGPIDRTGSATLAAAAMLNSFAEIEAHSLKSDTNRYHFELSNQATRMWPNFEVELIEAANDHLPFGCAKYAIHSGGCFDQGTYVINNAAADQVDDKNFEAIVRTLKKFNKKFDYVDPQNIPNYYPAQRDRAIRAILIHNEGWLNPRLVIEELDTILTHNPKVMFVNAKAEKLIMAVSGIESVMLENKKIISGDVFLLANGAVAGNTLKQSELDLNIQPIFHGVGVSLELKAPDLPHANCIRTPNRGGACGIYAVPFFRGLDRVNDHILIGASNFLSPEPFFHARAGSVGHLLESAINEINENFFDAQLVRVNVGWRPTTQDTYPLLGKTSIGNLIIATGTKRNGFHLSPLISEMMSALMMGEDADERLDVFAPERKLIRELSYDDAIEIGIESLISQHYQHGYKPSNIRMERLVRKGFRRDLEELHNKVGALDWGIPPELINMYKRGYAR